jgi:hypothetical protein
MKNVFRSSILIVVVAALLVTPAFAQKTRPISLASSNDVTYTGQGLLADGFGGYDLNSELCGIANGADAEGPYLLWVLTATKADSATITGPWGTADMTKFGNGTFKYISGWYDPDTLPGNVTGTYVGQKKNAQLVISHGCRPFNTIGAWCSPGFWKNATDGAWALTGHSKFEFFNDTVFDYFYGATFTANPDLEAVLDNAPVYSGPPLAGTSGLSLNAFNATGAYLTDSLPGFHFDWDVMLAGSDDACPIDHHGNLK